MIETLESPSAYKISTVNDNRFVTAAEITSKLREQHLNSCTTDGCVIDYAACDPKAITDICGIDYA